jgi:IS30 family transposase
MNYKQLTLQKRYQITALIKAGLNQKSIAFEVGVNPSTISRELKRNNENVRGYNAELAQIISTKTEMQKAKRYSLTKPIEKYIRAKLKQDFSPEQISGRMKLDIGISVVHETIYRYTNKKNGGKLYLRHKNKKYHKRSNNYMDRGTIIARDRQET